MIYAGRRYREQVAAMRYALAANREKGAIAMQEALTQVAEAGRATGAALADTRKPPPVVPGRIRPKPVSTPASSEPERRPAVVVPGRRIRPAAAPVPQRGGEIAPAPEPEVVVVSPEPPKKPAVPVVMTAPVRRVVNPDHAVCKDPKGRVVPAFAAAVQHHFDHEYLRELEEYERYIAAVG